MRRSYYFVRHGQAVYQQKGFDRSRFAADVDWPLSTVGVAQAHRVAPALLQVGVERVVSSRLERARHTASIVADAGRLPHEHLWAGLNEIHPSTLRALPPEGSEDRWSWWDGWMAARAVRGYVGGRQPRGWDFRNAEDRVFGVLTRLDALEESRIAVFGHGYWILLASLLVRGRVRYRWIDNCSITRIDADGEGRYRLVAFAMVARRR